MRKEENGDVHRNAEHVYSPKQHDERKYLVVDASPTLDGWINFECFAGFPGFAVQGLALHAIEIVHVNGDELHVGDIHEEKEGAVHGASKHLRLIRRFYRQEALLQANFFASTSSFSIDIVFIFIFVVGSGGGVFLLRLVVQTQDAWIVQRGIHILFEYNSKASTNWRVHVRQKDFIV